MGCCLSSDHASNFPNSPSSHNNAALEESDDVKEVLPETATPPPSVISDSPFIKLAPLLDFSTPRYPFPTYGYEVPDDIGINLSEGVPEKRRNNNAGELRRRSPARSRNPSFSGEVKREKPAGRSPGRRSDCSPNRVNGSAYGRKRDSEDSSGRRSRSPVTRAGSPGQGKKTGRSPGRVGSGLGDKSRKLEMGTWAPMSNELLENPLVSMECFIFL